MCISYSSSKGDVLIWDDGLKVIASSDVVTHIDDETGLHVAKSECFNRVGQGRAEEEAVRSLAAVLAAYLGMQSAKGRLTPMIERSPWTREEITDAQAEELVGHWRQRRDRCVVSVPVTRTEAP